jgi:dipeptidyl aminopeptidase/acylaminoacyl peptidase
MTDFKPEAGTPRWSPDGHRIAFDSPQGGDYNIYVIDAEGGIPRRVTSEASDEFTPTWSRDGHWIYFSSTRTGSMQIWKMPDQGGPAVQVTRNGGLQARESWDGRDLYYSTPDPRAIWRMPVEGGDATALVQDPRLDFRGFAISRRGVCFVTSEETLREHIEEYAIRFLAFESGEVMEVFRKTGPFLHNRFAVSPDEEWMLYSEAPAPTSELMLVENFR